MNLTLHYSQPRSEQPAYRVSPVVLRNFVERLAFPRPHGTSANVKARDILIEQFGRWGQPRIIGGTQNVLLGDLQTARVLIGAHYDSVPGTIGADDNASAVAVMLAVMQASAGNPRVAAVAFNCEENGLLGSHEFVSLLPKTHSLEVVHVLEMVGYRSRRPGSQRDPLPGLGCPTTGDFLGIVGNSSAVVDQILKAASAVSIPVVGLPVPENIPTAMISAVAPHLLRSDHASFWEQAAGRRIPATMWTDTAEFRNPNYHQATDTPETLDYEFMAEVAELLLEVCR